jgi:translation initiation factor 2 beta subunit (eIF-2beta)/eIF-5
LELIESWKIIKSRTVPNKYESSELIYNELLSLKGKVTIQKINKIIKTDIKIYLICSICGLNNKKIIKVKIKETNNIINICEKCTQKMNNLYKKDKNETNNNK